MAKFNLYYPKLEGYEGGYVSAQTAAKIGDKGGETYKGIARNFNKDWAGWKIIDNYKALHGTPAYNSIIPDAKLNSMAKEHSKTQYWDVLKLDQVKDQSVAEAMGDFGFNSGPGAPIKAVQKILKLEQDGKIGSETIAAINKANPKRLFNEIQAYRVEYIRNSSLSDKLKNQLIDNRVSKMIYETQVAPLIRIGQAITNNWVTTIVVSAAIAGITIGVIKLVQKKKS